MTPSRRSYLEAAERGLLDWRQLRKQAATVKCITALVRLGWLRITDNELVEITSKGRSVLKPKDKA